MLHRQNGQFEADHAPDFARPQAAALTTCSATTLPLSVMTSQAPSGPLLQIDDAGEAHDLGAAIVAHFA
jgi:hypothetical protein